ncbi:ABC transporter permease subunit [Anaerococcus sp. Marseille-P9784]|uniref:ABC transporter permease subunit n=1 Tax=Anaerococcus sp. Marseille-P9784 TaxID=2614127 RepID=UPI00124AA04C|nr:sugar ABC transporter permease [Anaerococcus sp. Marseille-P9784]
MKYQKDLVDDRGKTYPRKNEYIKDIIDGKNPDRNSHPYIIKLNEYQKKEKELLDKAKKEADSLETSTENSSEFKDLNKKLYISKAMVEFYEENSYLTYDASLKAKQAEIYLNQIPQIIEHDLDLKNKLTDKSNKISLLSEKELNDANEKIAKEKKLLEEEYQKSLANLKESFEKNLISAKAYKSEKEKYKKRFEDSNKAIEFLNPKNSLEEEIKSLKYKVKQDVKEQRKILASDLAEARRRNPVETEKTSPWRSIVSLPLPGLGQLLNGQWQKALVFFLGSLFIYLIAIPYALGFGNYQGEGISGLISLAANGGRLDRSILFMIEGILAIVFLLIALFILIVSFLDVRKVEKAESLGVRPNNWFESVNILRTDGFPYLITTPALLVIIFIVLVPIFTAILISFTDMNPKNQNKFHWIGLENYITIAKGQGIAGQAFWKIFGWTLIWTIGASTLAIVLGFIFALLVNNERIKAKKFFRTVYLLPWAVPAFITIMFFSIMTSRGGVFSETLGSIFNTSLDIKNDAFQTRLALILIQGWLGHSYIFLLTTGVLQAIPKDLYEAASIDGANGLKQTFKITIPLVLFQIAPMLINQYTFNFNNFSIIYLYNQGGPFNPKVYGNLAGSSDILISYIYKLTMESQYQAIGAAITIFISIILIIISYLGYRKSSAFKEY